MGPHLGPHFTLWGELVTFIPCARGEGALKVQVMDTPTGNGRECPELVTFIPCARYERPNTARRFGFGGNAETMARA